MSTLNAAQKKFLNVYDNLRYDAARFVASPTEPQNLAEQMFDGFMQNDSFTEAMRASAVDLGRMDILATIDDYIPKTNAGNSLTGTMVNDLVTMIDRGEDVGDLTQQPASPTYAMGQLNTFWNIAANIHESSPELYTHLVSDKRYVSMFEQTVAANEYSPDSVKALRDDVLKVHQDAAKTLGTIEYDVFQATYNGMSDDIYDLLEKGDFETIGENFTKDAPQTIFSGLKVTAPLPAAKLTEVSVTYDEYYGGMQAEKNLIADLPEIKPLPGELNFGTPDIKLPELPQLAGELNIDTASITGATTALAKNFNVQASAVAAVTPAVTAQATVALEQPVAEEDKTYDVQKGDNLWKIAKNEYGLTNYKDIMRAVEHIAHENGLDEGVQANRIKPGMELSMPSKDTIATPVQKLDWAALDADKMTNTRQLAFN